MRRPVAFGAVSSSQWLAERLGGVCWRSVLAECVGGANWRSSPVATPIPQAASDAIVRSRCGTRLLLRAWRCPLAESALAERVGGLGWRTGLAESALAERVGGVTWRSCFRQAWSLVRFGCGFLARDLVGEWVPNASACHPPCVRGVRTAGADVSWPTLPLELRPLTSRPIRIRPQSETNRPIRRQSGAQNKTVLSSARSDCGWRSRRGRAGTISIWQRSRQAVRLGAFSPPRLAGRAEAPWSATWVPQLRSPLTAVLE
jgi:hypothetical protein